VTAIASVLSVYNISKAVDGNDDHGNIITPEIKLKLGPVWFVTLFLFAAQNCGS